MVSAGVLAVGSDDELLLILRTDNGLWGLPGGALEPVESLEAAARRELAEETGLRAGELEMITVLSGPEFFYRYPNGDEVHNVIAVYTAAQVTGTPRPCNAETSEVRRFPLSDLAENILAIDRQASNTTLPTGNDLRRTDDASSSRSGVLEPGRVLWCIG